MQGGVLVYRVNAAARSGGGNVTVYDGNSSTGDQCALRQGRPHADTPFSVGQSFDDPTTGVTIAVTGRDASDHYTVRITRT